MARGGYRQPKGGPRASGVGKNSKRTDGQPIDVPNVQDSTELTQGDRQQLEAGQRTQRIGSGQPPNVQSTGSALPQGNPTQLGEHVFTMPTTRPTEPLTTGLPFGEGGGPEVLQSRQIPDDKQLLLDFLARGGNNDAIERIRSGIVNEQRPPDMRPQPTMSSAEAPAMSVIPEEEPDIEEAPTEGLPPENINVPDEAMTE